MHACRNYLVVRGGKKRLPRSKDSEFIDSTSHLKLKRLVVTAEGGQDEHWVQIRLFGLHEITSLLMMGFKVIEVSGSFRTRSAFYSRCILSESPLWRRGGRKVTGLPRPTAFI